MAVTYTGTKVSQTELKEITGELYQDSATFREKIIDVQEGHKNSAWVYESKVTVTAKAATDGPVTADGTIDTKANATQVALDFLEFSDFIAEKTLLGTRFEKSMAAGAYNLISDEYDKKVLIDIQPAIGEAMENFVWNGAKAATKVSIAALVPGAGQGSISAGAQTLVAAMPSNLMDSIPATILHNASQAKAVPGAGLGDYIKVLSIAGAVTSANIADEYAKMYSGAPQKVTANKTTPPQIFAPLEDMAMIKVANNSVGAASNKNFLVEGSGASEVISYNGVVINFVPLVGFRILCNPVYLKVLMDLVSDLSSLEVGPVANGAQMRWYKNIVAITTWVTNQRYITLYGG
jgi:hypothetical protein